MAVTITITNTGDSASREIVQVYLEPAEDDQPIRLVGWQPVRAEPGQSVPVEVSTDPRLWRRWDTAAALMNCGRFPTTVRIRTKRESA